MEPLASSCGAKACSSISSSARSAGSPDCASDKACSGTEKAGSVTRALQSLGEGNALAGYTFIAFLLSV